MTVNLKNVVPFSAGSRKEIEQKIDRFLGAKTRRPNDHKSVPLILTVSGSHRFDYRGISVREWHSEGRVRFDAAVELL